VEGFRDFLLVDLRQSKKTAYEKVYYIRKFLKSLDKPLDSVSNQDIRQYLKGFMNSNATYKNMLGSLKTFFRDYKQKPEIVNTFKFPRPQFKPKSIISLEDLQRFYQALETTKEKALFLLYACSGLRRNEILSLTLEDLDQINRMIIPCCHSGDTKKSFISFYNAETETILKQYLEERKKNNGHSNKLFPFARDQIRNIWKTAKQKTGLDITPQRLREFFCVYMSELGIQDRYIDAFCGRTPKSVLAKHYTDYNPTKLKAIYEKANLKLLA
jgi:integrase